MGGSNGRESQGVGEEGKEPAARGVGAWWLAQVGHATSPAERRVQEWKDSHVRKN